MKRFLIIKTSALGDIIHAYPIVRYLRSHFPDATINWVVEEAGSPLVQTHPDVSNTFKISTHRWRKNLGKWSTWQEIRAFIRALRKESYDAVFDLQGNVKSGILTSLTRAKAKIGFGRATVPEWPNILFTTHRYNPPADRNIVEDNLYLVQKFFQDVYPSNLKNWNLGSAKVPEFDLLKSNPYYNMGSILEVESRELSLELKTNFSSCLGITTVEPSPVKLQISTEQQKAIDQILSQPELVKTPRLMICPGSAWANKQMSEEALLDLMQRLKQHKNCSFLLVWGNEKEKALSEHLQTGIGSDCYVIPKLPLPALQNLMGNVDLVISMDSLALHLAASIGTSTFSIFGASLAKKYAPLGPQHLTMQGTCPYSRTFEKRCPILRKCPTGLCIKSLSGKQAFEALRTHSLLGLLDRESTQNL